MMKGRRIAGPFLFIPWSDSRIARSTSATQPVSAPNAIGSRCRITIARSRDGLFRASVGDSKNDSTFNDVLRGTAAVFLRDCAGRSPRGAFGAGADGETARRNQRQEFPARQQGAYGRGVRRVRGSSGQRV